MDWRTRASAALAAAGLCVGCAPSTSGTPRAGSTMSTAIVDPYLRIQTALAHDSIEGVKQNAGNLATAATALGAPAFKIDTAAISLSAAGDLADARDRFGALSAAIDTYMTGEHLGPPPGVRVAFCPMVRQPWLQRDGDLANPYFGSAMLTCGSFR